MQRNPDESCLVRPFCRRKDGHKRELNNNSLIIKTKTTMEENMNLTAERSLEIITEQIERSRRSVSKDTGQSLFVSGLCMMGMAVIVAIVNIIAGNNGFLPIGHLLWMILPLIIWLIMRRLNKNHHQAPVDIVSSLVGKTWWTFAVFTLGFFFLGNIWNFIMSRLCSPQEYMMNDIHISTYVILLMAMAVSIMGHILKKQWLVWFGIIGGLLIAVGDRADIIAWLLGYLYTFKTVGLWCFIKPCPTIFLFAFFGLTLPGWILKREK